jgi:hypothetical protein
MQRGRRHTKPTRQTPSHLLLLAWAQRSGCHPHSPVPPPLAMHVPETDHAPDDKQVALGAPVKPLRHLEVHVAPLAAGRGEQANATALGTAAG